MVGPWAGAVTVATDGGFWSAALGGDLGPKLVGGQETHGAAPGYHTLLASFLLFPMTLLIPLALVTAWTPAGGPRGALRDGLAGPGLGDVRADPRKLVALVRCPPMAIAWLAAAGLNQPQGRWVRWSRAGRCRPWWAWR